MAEYDNMEEMNPADFSKPGVLDKFRAAAQVANKVMAKVVEECVAGKRIAEICRMADAMIVAELPKAIKAPSAEELADKDDDEREADDMRGVAFPTCLSLNNCAAHFSPLSDDQAKLAAGDVVKIDLGAHAGGFAAVLAHTVVVPGAPDVVDRRADAVAAAFMAFQCVARALRPGVKSTELTEEIERVGKAFGVAPLEGVLSHNVTRFVLDGPRVFPCAKPSSTQEAARFEEFEVAPLEVFAVDVSMSSGEGRARDAGNSRTTVFKRNPDTQYLLKLKASRATLAEIQRDFPAFPFTLRMLSDEKRAKLGVAEMVSHGILDAYPVLHDRAGEAVAQFKGTFLVGAKGTAMLAGPPGIPARVRSGKSEAAMGDAAIRASLGRALISVDELAASLGEKKKKKRSKASAMKKKKAAAASAAEPASAAAPASEHPQAPAPMQTEAK